MRFKMNIQYKISKIVFPCMLALLLFACAEGSAIVTGNVRPATDPESVTQALRTTELQIATLPGKGVKFDQNGQNIWIDSTMSQIQKGEYKVVWPSDWATTAMVWPMRP